MSDQQQKNRKAPRDKPTKAAVSERLEIKPEDIDPHHDWSRLNAHGVMNVDFEERVDFRRLHRYRLGRARQAVRNSTLGRVAVLRQQQYPLHHLDRDRRVVAR